MKPIFQTELTVTQKNLSALKDYSKVIEGRVWAFKHLNINKYLLSTYYVLGPVVGAGDRRMNTIAIFLVLTEMTS